MPDQRKKCASVRTPSFQLKVTSCHASSSQVAASNSIFWSVVCRCDFLRDNLYLIDCSRKALPKNCGVDPKVPRTRRREDFNQHTCA